MQKSSRAIRHAPPPRGHADHGSAPPPDRRTTTLRLTLALLPFAVGLAIGIGLSARPGPVTVHAATAPPTHNAKPSASTTAAREQPQARLENTRYVYSQAVITRLREVCQQKKRAIEALFEEVEQAAREVVSDATMLTCFQTMRDAYAPDPPAAGQRSPAATAALRQYRRAVTEYYALNFARFYDILFVSRDRFVFHSFRGESDLHHRVDDGSKLAAGLRDTLEGKPHAVVVDYHYYPPSERAAAFFILPVVQDNHVEGWMVVQYAVNVLDSLLVDHNELGRTGEVYLLNHEHRMVTDSRFSGERTHLRYTVDSLDLAIQQRPPPGDGLMHDYRGERVFAAYDRIAMFGQTWLIVAQIDEAEVITNHYQHCPPDSRDALLSAAANLPLEACAQLRPAAPPRRVGLDEFAKTTATRPVATQGVSTCTAVVVRYPGRFSYLAHVSPYDKIYGTEQLTNTLKQVIHRVMHYDIYQSELNRLEVIIIAPHLNSIPGALDKLLRYGITLDQIRFLCRPGAHYANVLAQPAGGPVQVIWADSAAAASTQAQLATSVPDLGEFLRRQCRLGVQPGKTPSQTASAASATEASAPTPSF